MGKYDPGRDSESPLRQTADLRWEFLKTGNEQIKTVQKYRKIPKISPSMYKPPKLVTQKTLC